MIGLKLKFILIGLIPIAGMLNFQPSVAYADVEESAPTFWQADLEEVGKLEGRKTGWASWYGKKFHGRKTANGERYNQHAFTCASRSLPFGTILEVTNIKNGKSAVVRVNDRGPYRKGRILDLSYAVAKQLGFLKRGVAKVAYAILYHPRKKKD